MLHQAVYRSIGTIRHYCA